MNIRTALLKNTCKLLPSGTGIYCLCAIVYICMFFSGTTPAQNTPFLPEETICLKTQPFTSAVPIADERIRVKHYRLDLSLDYDTRTIKGNTSLSFTVLSGSIYEVFFNLSSSFQVDSVIIFNVHADFTHTGDILYVRHPNQFSFSGAKAVIYYSGTPASTGFGSFVFGNILSHKAIWSLSEPYGSQDWFPNKNSVSDKADSADIIITVDTSFTAVSNGLLQSKTVNGSKATFHWKTKYPIANYLISVAVAPYQLYTNYFKHSVTDSMPVTHYSTPDFFEARKPQFDKTIAMLHLFTGLFGEYPFIKEKYGHAEFGRGGGMEHQTISSMGGFNDGLIAHELAHQWFGDKVTNNNWQHIWLHEGFATYAEGLWYESLDPSFYQQYMTIREGPAKAATGSILVQDISNVYSIFDFNRSYAKASWVPHMLRGVLGDSLFFFVLKRFLSNNRYAYKTADTEDFEMIVSGEYGKPLARFFDQWIYKAGYPKYLISYKFQINPDGTHTTNLLIDQTANVDGVVFEMPVRVVVHTTAGDVPAILHNSLAVENFSVVTNGEPLSVSIDPDNWILKEVNLLRDYSAGTLAKGYTVRDIYPNPAGPSMNLLVELLDAKDISLTVYNSAGARIGGILHIDGYSGLNKIELHKLLPGLASGTYLVGISVGENREYRKVLFLK